MSLAEAARLFPFELVPELAQFDEIGTCLFGIVEKRRKGHEAVDLYSLELRGGCQDFTDLAGIRAEFCRFVPKVHLDQDREAFAQVPAGITEPGSQFDTVERVDDVEQFRGTACLVRLQMTDQVPLDAVPAAQGGDFGFRFLDSVLAEAALARGSGLRDCLWRKGLADGDKRHAVLRPACGNTRPCDEISHFREIPRDVRHEFGVELVASLCYSPSGILNIFSGSGKDSRMFITFEGIEGSGKSLQIGRARDYLESRGIECLVTREPGGTPFGQAVRQILLGTGGAPREPMSELLLYLADRYQHLHEVVEPAMRRGVTVLSDRYHDATLAYQGAARGIPIEKISGLARLLRFPEPGGTILLDLDPQVGLARARRRNATDSAAGSEGRFEAEEIEFHRAVRKAYLGLARSSPQRIRIVPADGTPDEVFMRIEPLLNEWVIHAE